MIEFPCIFLHLRVYGQFFSNQTLHVIGGIGAHILYPIFRCILLPYGIYIGWDSDLYETACLGYYCVLISVGIFLLLISSTWWITTMVMNPYGFCFLTPVKNLKKQH